MNKLIAGLIVGLMLGFTVYALAGTLNPYANAEYQAGDTQTKACLMYGMMTDGTIYPVLVNASGAVKTF